MKRIALLLAIIVLLSCNNKKGSIKGDLYFKLIDFPTFHETFDTNFSTFKKVIDSIKNQKNISKEEQNFVDYYYKLEKFNLLKTPFIKIKTKKTTLKKFS